MSALILISNDWKCIGCQCVCVRSTLPVELDAPQLSQAENIYKKKLYRSIKYYYGQY